MQSLCLLGACLWLGRVQSIWILLPHSGRLGQIYVMWDDAATDATEPAGSTPEGELTGKPCSINSNPF